jgi:lipoate-protein ligase A
MKPGTWRLILSPPASGAWNMALDEAILDEVIAQKQSPTLRFYTWEPACLSLGHAQSVKDVDLTALQAHGWDLVRRPTGGRAILHTDELTYSICALQDESIMAGGILDSYRRISLALVQGLANLGVEAHADSRYSRPDGVPENAAVCFETPSNYEITAQGKKIIGSAQARRNLGILQHGSLPLYGDLTRITEVLHFTNPGEREQAKQRLLRHATTVEAILGTTVSWEQAARSMITAFSSVLGLNLNPEEPDDQEIERASILMDEKYANEVWTCRI